MLAPLAAYADPLDPSSAPSWLDMVTATQAAQPHWMTPLVTVTPRLEQEFRWDFYDQQDSTGSRGNGQRIASYGGPGGPRIEFIPSENVELIAAAPPIEDAAGSKGAADGVGDWPLFLAKYRFLSANEQNGNYIVSGFFQMSAPMGAGGKISNDVLTAQPTLAFGKGWGDFNIQTTISEQFPVSAISSPGSSASENMKNFGDPTLWNTAFQYHISQFLWPEFEVNYEYWPNGEHAGYSQVMFTPGIIFGRFPLGNSRENLIVGAGYQFAVTNNPVIANNVVVSARISF
jgi:hypothetical protein